MRKSFVRAVYDASGHDLTRTQRIVSHNCPIVTARYLETTDTELDVLVLSLFPATLTSRTTPDRRHFRNPRRRLAPDSPPIRQEALRH